MSNAGSILIFFFGGLTFLGLVLGISRLLRPDRPGKEKLSTYESGEEPLGSAWVQVNLRFYVLAIIFLLFEIEVVFIFPWATVFGDAVANKETNHLWGWYALVEMFIFIIVLLMGLVYAWRNGHLDWLKPERNVTEYKSPVPRELYDKVNERYSKK